MKRPLSYVGQQVYEWAFSAPAQYAMTALAKVCQSMFGTATTVNGLACTATSPASMSVIVGPGEIYQMASLEATVAGTLPADTARTILKQGIQLDNVTTSTFATPGTSGQSIAYLIQAQYADQDISVDPTTGNTPVVLQYYNDDAPSVPWSGPNNSGDASNTFRDGIVSLNIKAGAAAATGSQVTPSPDSGYVGLSVVTVAYGQTTITAANIASYPSAPRLSDALLNQIAARALLNGSTSNRFSAAAAVAGTDVPPLQQVQAMQGMFRSTSVPISGSGSLSVSQSGAIIPLGGSSPFTLVLPTPGGNAGIAYWLVNISGYPVTLTTPAGYILPPNGGYSASYVIQPGESYMVTTDGGNYLGYIANRAPTTSAPFGPSTALSGNCANGATAITLTDRAVHVTSDVSLPGHKISNFSATLDLTKTGVIGGMIGSAPAAGQFLAVYAFFNPSTNAYGIMAVAVNTTATITQVYGSGAPISGYTESCLLAVLPASQTTAGQLAGCNVKGKRHSILLTSAYTSNNTPTAKTAVSISALVPAIAIRIAGIMNTASLANANSGTLSLSADASGIGQCNAVGYSAVGGGFGSSFDLDLITPQVAYFSSTLGANGSAGFGIGSYWLP